MNVIIFGGSGFVGSWIARYLSQLRNYNITVICRPESNLFKLQGIDGIQIINRNVESWAFEVEQHSPDVLILADWWGVGNDLRNDQLQFMNIDRQSQLVTSAVKVGVKTIIGIGSQAELGQINAKIPENQIDNPTNEYGRAKVATRVALMNLTTNSDSRFVWMRIFSTYGPLDTGNWLIPNCIRKLSEKEVFDATLGEQEWSYLHALDLARAFEFVINNEIVRGSVNVGNPETIFIGEVLGQIQSRMKLAGYINFGSMPYRKDQVMKLAPKCEKLLAVGWRPIVSFGKGLDQTLDWLLGNVPENLATLDGNFYHFSLPSIQKIIE